MSTSTFMRECRNKRAKELGLKYVVKYADSLYSKDGENGPYFKFDIMKWDFVEIKGE